MDQTELSVLEHLVEELRAMSDFERLECLCFLAQLAPELVREAVEWSAEQLALELGRPPAADPVSRRPGSYGQATD